MNPEFTRLVVRDSGHGEPGSFVVRQEVVPAPWTPRNEAALEFSTLPQGIQQRVVGLAAGNWPRGEDDFMRGLRGRERWALQHLEATVRDNERASRGAMNSCARGRCRTAPGGGIDLHAGRE
ncbi:hypothetical protein [Myxococcus faecalis]|uniref:hypothetical protein n=1 Tax=Myxococcus faecalis TaxID=3115646 RepID=UPI003CF7E659